MTTRASNEGRGALRRHPARLHADKAYDFRGVRGCCAAEGS